MKLLKTLAIGALALASAGAVSAQTVVRIVASNGDRTATQTAISKLLAPGWTYQGINGNTSSSGDLAIATGSNAGAWNGTYAGNPVIIKATYAGALAGIAAVSSNPKIDQRFVVSNGTGTGSVPNPLTATNLGVDYELGKADFGFSTNFQSTSPFNGLFQGVQYDAVIEEIVGISPLGFYASPGFPGTNITTQLAQQLYKSGRLTADLFTGNVADANKTVWAIGRNTDAGQRFGAYTEIGLGTQSQVTTWLPSITGQTTTSGITYGGTVNSHQLWPVATQPGTFAVPLGSGGYNSGANVAPPLTATLGPSAYKGEYVDDDDQTQYLYPNATAGYYIGYLTPGDANNRVLGNNGVVPEANRGVALTYNGVALTNENVRSGRYTAWLYNRILKPQSGLTGLKLTFADALRDQIKNVDAPAGGGIFDDASVLVKRYTDGGFVVKK
ncbi:MAG: hypothetical protein WC076_04935 [Terrimicrobiaceae bacterium]|nr:hypothetical protein [Terrimicrobiaceae bacterium]